MSTPTWARFSPVSGTVESLINDSSELRTEHRFRLREMGRLARSKTGGVIAFDDDSMIAVSTESEAMTKAHEWEGMALCYDVLSINATIYLYYWHQDEKLCLAVQTDTQIPFHESDELREGEWLERFLIAYTAACGATTCAYGKHYPISYEPFDEEIALSQLRDGTLLRLPHSNLHVIAIAPSKLGGDGHDHRNFREGSATELLRFHDWISRIVLDGCPQLRVGALEEGNAAVDVASNSPRVATSLCHFL